MEDKIIDIVADVCEDETLKNDLDRDLFESDLLDSLAFITLMERLDEEFNIEIQPTQIKPECWRTINSIIELVKSYKK